MKKSYYAIIPADVRYDDRLIPNAKLLYGEITALCNEKGYCWAGNSYFTELYGVSDRAVRNWLEALREYGYIDVQVVKEEGNKRYITLRKKSSVPTEEKFRTYGRNLPDLRKKSSVPTEEKFRTPNPAKPVDVTDESMKKTSNTTINNTNNNTMNNTSNKESTPRLSKEDVNAVITKWNEVGLVPIRALSPSTERYRSLRARVNEYGLEDVLEAIDNINYSSFLKGDNGRKWTISFDWLVKPNNFIKVLEGQYTDTKKVTESKVDNDESDIYGVATDDEGNPLVF